MPRPVNLPPSLLLDRQTRVATRPPRWRGLLLSALCLAAAATATVTLHREQQLNRCPALINN